MALDPVPDEQLQAECEAVMIELPSAEDAAVTLTACPIHAPRKLWRGDCATCVFADLGSPGEDGFEEVAPAEDPTEELPDPGFNDFEEAWAAIQAKLARPTTRNEHHSNPCFEGVCHCDTCVEAEHHRMIRDGEIVA
jgi:hypothetical protein